MTRTVGDLTPQDVGRTVTIDSTGARITGRLRTVRTETDWISVRELGSKEPHSVPGMQTVTLAVGPWVTGQLPPSTPVEIAP